MKVVVCGDVDSGKSTFIGNLLFQYNKDIYNHNNLYDITDSLSEEKEKNITLHSSQFTYKDSILINCPGHEEYLKDTISRISEATHGILIVNHKTIGTKLTNLYKDLFEMFSIPYKIVFNRINKIKNNNFDYSFDLLVDDLEIVLNDLEFEVLKPKEKNNTNKLKVILFDSFDQVVSLDNDENLDLYNKIRLNDYICLYNSYSEFNSSDRIIFYKDKDITGLGIFY